jgi:hypothetical protein
MKTNNPAVNPTGREFSILNKVDIGNAKSHTAKSEIPKMVSMDIPPRLAAGLPPTR